MMVARLIAEGSENNGLLVILEPGNLAKLQLGQPVVKKLRDFLPELPIDVDLMICYTPDILYVREKIEAGASIPDAIEAAKMRPEVYRRPDHAEEMVKAK